MERSRVTQKTVAAAAGVSQPSVAKWLAGGGCKLEAAKMQSLARFFGANPLWLSEGVGEPWDDDAGKSSTAKGEETASGAGSLITSATAPETFTLELPMPEEVFPRSSGKANEVAEKAKKAEEPARQPEQPPVSDDFMIPDEMDDDGLPFR